MLTALSGAMMCLLAAPVAGSLAGRVAAASFQEPPAARLTFDVVSIRRHAQPIRVPRSGPADPPDVYYQSSVTVAFLIQFAYNVQNARLSGGPEWIRRDEYEINAKAPRAASIDEMRLMVQSLLEERFALVVRRERREMTFFDLRVARRDGRVGTDLERCEDPEAPRNAPTLWIPLPPDGTSTVRRCAPISTVVSLAAAVLQAPVFDRTELSGLWNYVLIYRRPRLPSASPAGSALREPAVPFETALNEQLGLRLESRRGPVDVLVIESVEQPTEN